MSCVCILKKTFYLPLLNDKSRFFFLQRDGKRAFPGRWIDGYINSNFMGDVRMVVVMVMPHVSVKQIFLLCAF